MFYMDISQETKNEERNPTDESTKDESAYTFYDWIKLRLIRLTLHLLSSTHMLLKVAERWSCLKFFPI